MRDREKRRRKKQGEMYSNFVRKREQSRRRALKVQEQNMEDYEYEIVS